MVKVLGGKEADNKRKWRKISIWLIVLNAVLIALNCYFDDKLPNSPAYWVTGVLMPINTVVAIVFAIKS